MKPTQSETTRRASSHSVKTAHKPLRRALDSERKSQDTFYGIVESETDLSPPVRRAAYAATPSLPTKANGCYEVSGLLYPYPPTLQHLLSAYLFLSRAVHATR